MKEATSTVVTTLTVLWHPTAGIDLSVSYCRHPLTVTNLSEVSVGVPYIAGSGYCLYWRWEMEAWVEIEDCKLPAVRSRWRVGPVGNLEEVVFE